MVPWPKTTNPPREISMSHLNDGTEQLSARLKRAVRAAENQLDCRLESLPHCCSLDVTESVESFRDPWQNVRLRFGSLDSVPHRCLYVELTDKCNSTVDDRWILHETFSTQDQLAIAQRIPEFIKIAMRYASITADECNRIISAIDAATERLSSLIPCS